MVKKTRTSSQLKAAAVCLLAFAASGLAIALSQALATNGEQNQAAFEPGEHLPGGTATTDRALTTRDAFSQSSEGIDFAGEATFKVGNAIFRRFWISSPSSNNASDGLGPLYNARGCQNCHLKDGRGRPPEANWPDETAVSLFLRLSIPPQTDEQAKALASRRINAVAEPVYGGQLQNIAIQGHRPEGQLHITYTSQPVTLGDGTTITLRKPHYKIIELGYGAMHPEVMTSPRIAPQMIGMGLLEAIPEASIRALADPGDANGDGISGKPNEVYSQSKKKIVLGRFGWKAGNPDVRQQSSDAFFNDMGLSTTLNQPGYGDCTEAQQACRKAPDGASDLSDNVEVSDQFLDLVTFYARNLAVPKRRNARSPEVLKGKATFNAIGCAKCHHPSFKTGDVKDQPYLSNQTIWPYTDLLLHDMGEGLADNRPEGAANGREWRTPPLWGIGLTQQVSGHEYFLHDGRARGLEEAILWHGGEAEDARNKYADLAKKEREALLAFVKSL